MSVPLQMLQQIEVQIVLVCSALAFADLFFGLNEFYSFNPLDRLVAQLILYAQPQRSPILVPERRPLGLQNIIQALGTVIRSTVQSGAKRIK